jgi:hypothetical protein
MNEEPDVRALSSAVKHRRCAQCYGPVVLRCTTGGVWAIQCPRGCSPGGHVTEDYAEQAIARDVIDAEKVLANYPELRPDRGADNPAAARKALFGE